MKSPIHHLQDLQSQLNALASQQGRQLAATDDTVSQAQCTARKNAYNDCWSMIQGKICQIQDEKLEMLCGGITPLQS